jgi:CubicO group peptidase (beta-lactamase class C family)
VDNEIGPWVASHGLSPADYQSKFNELTPKGYFPLCVQAAGSNKDTAGFDVIFATREELTPRQWNSTGPVANAGIDAVMQSIMEATPARHAALAIVKGKKLVFARGYSWAEPDWPLVQPTTRFRIASVSKTIMALAIYQLIEGGKVKLTDKVQDILQLKTPGGSAPVDARFGTVDIRQLLEHASSIDANSYRLDMSVLKAYQDADPSGNWQLPVTAAMTDAYIAGLNLGSADPGGMQGYNNCGYYLLGRVLAKKRGAAKPIDALQSWLFDPLHITRIRRARSLLTDQPADEARYRISVVGEKEDARLDIATAQSVMTKQRPIVPVGYGHEQYEKQEGSGGLSAAVTDLARIAAVLISQTNNPALKRSTITTMFANGLATQTAYVGKTLDGKGPRAGHGFDAVSALAGGKYMGQKGGSLDTSGNALSFNGDWGMAVCWSGKLIAPYQGQSWYPYFPGVMDIAKSTSWGSGDLFPLYGMPSL